MIDIEVQCAIVDNPQFYEAVMYVYDRNHFYTVTEGGRLLSTKREEGLPYSDPPVFLRAPISVLDSIAKSLKKRAKEDVGAEFYKGQIDRYQNEVEFLRSLTHKPRKS